MPIILCAGASNTEDNTDAVLVAEDFELTKIGDGELRFRVKLRNISDKDLKSVHFMYQVLDKNGDILCSQECGASSVDAGQAIWAGEYGVKNEHIEEAFSMSFVSSIYTPGNEKTPLQERATFPLFDEHDKNEDTKNSFAIRNGTVFADDVDALKNRIEELEAEIATKDAIIAALVKASNTAEDNHAIVFETIQGPLHETPAPTSQPEEEYLTILDLKLKPYKDGQYWPNVKLQSLYPKEKHGVDPMTITLYFTVRDKENIIIQSEGIQLSRIGYKDIGWSYTFDKALRILVNPDEAATIEFTGYRMGFQGIPVEGYDFEEPYIYQLSEVEIE